MVTTVNYMYRRTIQFQYVKSSTFCCIFFKKYAQDNRKKNQAGSAGVCDGQNANVAYAIKNLSKYWDRVQEDTVQKRCLKSTCISITTVEEQLQQTTAQAELKRVHSVRGTPMAEWWNAVDSLNRWSRQGCSGRDCQRPKGTGGACVRLYPGIVQQYSKDSSTAGVK